eukprot:GHVO01050039.1.p1 GENE.GHVO01050039.1~~GHVO01050039.1.p1  ORF type:complete len:402 (-),score=62.37 GHVO01050039.1:69-1274(-)
MIHGIEVYDTGEVYDTSVSRAQLYDEILHKAIQDGVKVITEQEFIGEMQLDSVLRASHLEPPPVYCLADDPKCQCQADSSLAHKRSTVRHSLSTLSLWEVVYRPKVVHAILGHRDGVAEIFEWLRKFEQFKQSDKGAQTSHCVYSNRRTRSNLASQFYKKSVSQSPQRSNNKNVLFIISVSNIGSFICAELCLMTQGYKVRVLTCHQQFTRWLNGRKKKLKEPSNTQPGLTFIEGGRPTAVIVRVVPTQTEISHMERTGIGPIIVCVEDDTKKTNLKNFDTVHLYPPSYGVVAERVHAILKMSFVDIPLSAVSTLVDINRGNVPRCIRDAQLLALVTRHIKGIDIPDVCEVTENEVLDFIADQALEIDDQESILSTSLDVRVELDILGTCIDKYMCSSFDE